MIRPAALFLCLLLSSVQTCFGLTVTFKAKASVKGASITLANVAVFNQQTGLARALATQVISNAPPPGQDETLQTANIRLDLMETLSIPASVDWQGPAFVHVHRDGINIGPDKIQTIIARFLKRHQNILPEARISFVPRSLPLPFTLPSGKLSWDVIPSSPGILSSTAISIIFSVDGRVRKNIAIAGRIKALVPVVVAASSIEHGSIVSAKQLKIVTRDIARSSSFCLDPHEIIGDKANRDIGQGSIIERSWINIPPMVTAGQQVKIELNEGNLHVEATGLARMNGAKDQIIRVQNMSSKKMLYCRVTAPGIVEVQL